MAFDCPALLTNLLLNNGFTRAHTNAPSAVRLVEALTSFFGQFALRQRRMLKGWSTYIQLTAESWGAPEIFVIFRQFLFR
jgi:hypothetical protein